MARERRNTKSPMRNGAFGVLLLALAGCAEGVDFNDPQFPFASRYDSGGRIHPVVLAESEWWQRFGDQTLDQLVEAGLRGNIDLEIARERVVEARFRLQTVAPDATFDTSARLQQQVQSDSDDTFARSEITGSFSWLFDPFGRRQSLLDAADAQIDAADARLDAARLLLLSEIANAYVNLRFNQRVLTLRQGELRSRRETRGLILDLIEQNAATQLDRVEANALIAESEATIPTIQAEIRGSLYQLAVLLGRQPGDLPVAIGDAAGQPNPQMQPDIGIPADILRNRPDVEIAEQLYYAAVANANFAEADLYPRLSLQGTISLERVLSDGLGTAVFGPAVQFPALPDGPRVAELRARESAARQAHLTWEQTVLDALGEVETVIVSYEASLRSAASAQRALSSRIEARSLTIERVESGIDATIRDLLDAEVDVAQSGIVLAQRRRQVALDFVALHIALGAGHGVTRDEQVHYAGAAAATN